MPATQQWFNKKRQSDLNGDRVTRKSKDKRAMTIHISVAEPDRLAWFDGDAMKDLLHTKSMQNAGYEIGIAGRDAAAKNQEIGMQAFFENRRRRHRIVAKMLRSLNGNVSSLEEGLQGRRIGVSNLRRLRSFFERNDLIPRRDDRYTRRYRTERMRFSDGGKQANHRPVNLRAGRKDQFTGLKILAA